MRTRAGAGRERKAVADRAWGAARRSAERAAGTRAAAAAAPVRVAGLAVLMALAGAAPTPAAAQQQGPGGEAAPAQERPAADPADVESIDAIITALYDVISGPAGEARDWDRFRSLMYPGAVLLPNFPEQGQGPRAMTVEAFIGFAEEQIQDEAFYEDELHRSVQRFGPVVNVFSTYASRRTPDGDPFVRGVNSIQLIHDGDRWWVAHIAWTDVTEAGPIPERYGGGGS